MAEEKSQELLKKMTKAYIRLRDARAKLKSDFDAEDKKLEEQMDAIRNELLSYCKENGVDSVRTEAGLFYRTVKTRYWTGDWAAMHRFILEKGVPGLLEKRLNQSEVKAYIEEFPDQPLPGLNVDSEYSLSVRKP